MEEKNLISYKQLGDALKRLHEALQKPLDKDNMNRDATKQRFEFTIELFWKVLKKFLLWEKIVTHSPRETLQNAYSFNWIDNEKLWLRMMDDRNLTSHTYREEIAIQIYENIKEYYPEMMRCYQLLSEKVNS